VSALLLAIACVIHIAFLASLGVWLSMVCRNTLWSNMTMALVLLLLFSGSWLLVAADVSASPSGQTEVDWVSCFYEIGLNPVHSWWTLGFSWDDFGNLTGPYDPVLSTKLSAALAGLAAFAVLTGAFWLLARWRFRREVTRALARCPRRRVGLVNWVRFRLLRNEPGDNLK
jgi:hypothetical protein